MSDHQSEQFAAFSGHILIAAGSKHMVAVAVAAHSAKSAEPVTILSDLTGHLVDLDLRGSPAEIAARYAPTPELPIEKPPRGRPKLGVVPREVTLLARHWDWLATQPGGASAALRRLVDQARHDSGPADAKRQAQDATYRIMTALAGDLPNFEEALRAFYAGDQVRSRGLMEDWPIDVRQFILARIAD